MTPQTRLASLLLTLLLAACSDSEPAATASTPDSVGAPDIDPADTIGGLPDDTPVVPDTVLECTLVPLVTDAFASPHGFVLTGGARRDDGALVLEGDGATATLPGKALSGRLVLVLRLAIDDLPVASEVSFGLGSFLVVSVTRDAASASGRVRIASEHGSADLSVSLTLEMTLVVARDETGVQLRRGDATVSVPGATADPDRLFAALKGPGTIRVFELTLSACDAAPACTELECESTESCGGSYCNPLLGCGSVAASVACDDGIVCTVDSCGPGGCKHAPSDGACDDDKPCNGLETCDVASGCKAGSPPPGCCVVDADCSDGTLCSGVEACVAGTCRAGAPLVCNDGNACNGTESCAPASGCEPGVAPVCADANVCNGAEQCVPAVGCVPGVPLECGDESACTLDVCDPEVGCQVSLVTCDDNNVCNGFERCDLQTGCEPGTPLTCDDGQPCDGAETCAPLQGCVPGQPPLGCCASDFDCEDGVVCNGVATCNGSTGQCQLGIVPVCNDVNHCNGTEICDAALGCVSGPSPNCSDGNVCNGLERCDPVAGCEPGEPLSCQGTNVCAGATWCEPVAGCRSGVAPACDDGNVCNGLERCDPTLGCSPGTPLGCDDGRTCNGPESCDPLAGCVIGEIPAGCCTAAPSCDDGNPCNGSWTCDTRTGSCDLVAAPLSCAGGDLCGAHTECLPASGCALVPGLFCDDANLCNGVESCVSGVCVRAPAPSCDDGAACTSDVCLPGTGCSYGTLPEEGKPCDDGNACTVGDTCQAGVCGSGAVNPCDDGNPCTADSCDGVGGACVHPARPSGTPCDQDALSCTTAACNTVGECVTVVSATTCLVAGVCHQDGEVDPDNPCRQCPGGGATAFVDRADGSDCGLCATCAVGVCGANLAQHDECGACQKCVAKGVCGVQGAEDLKDECESNEGCQTGLCDGSGACGVAPASTDCGVCATCDGEGQCATDLDQHADCEFCQKCTDKGVCSVQATTEDAKDECGLNEGCQTGFCNGGGACGVAPAATGCGVCARCDGQGNCEAQLGQHADCGKCSKCIEKNVCGPQTAAEDLKGECSIAALSCTLDLCDGEGACAIEPGGSRCEDGVSCTIGDTCGEEGCVAGGDGLFDDTSGSLFVNSYFGAVAALADGGFVGVGSAYDGQFNPADVLIHRFDAAGEVLWTQRPMRGNGVLADEARAVAVLPDGGFAVAGYVPSFKDLVDVDFWLIRTDAAGEMVWNQVYGGVSVDDANDLAVLPDGGFVLVGTTLSKGAGSWDAWLVRTDSLGNLLFDQTFGGPGHDGATAVGALPDGGFIVAGSTYSKGAGASDGWLVRTDKNGRALWDHTYGGAGDDSIAALEVLPDAGFILAGGTSSEGVGAGDAWLLRVGADGTELWDRTFGGDGSEAAKVLTVMSDGGFALAGTTASYGDEHGDAWVVRADAKGNQLWDRAYGLGGEDFALGLAPTLDGGLVITGAGRDPAHQFRRSRIIRTDAWGNTSCAGSGSCPAALAVCDDGNPCTRDECGAADGGCNQTHLPDGTACASAETCTTADVCEAGHCVAGPPKLFDVTLGGPSAELTRAMVSLADGGFVLAGAQDAIGEGRDAWLVRTNSAGAKQWEATYGGDKDDHAKALAALPNGGFAFAAATESKGAGGEDFWLVTVDAKGVAEWDRTYGGTLSDSPAGVAVLADGGFALAGTTDSKGAGLADYWLVRTNPTGDVVWDQTYGGAEADQCFALARLPDGGFALAGNTNSKGQGNSDFWLVRTDSSGNALWDRTFGGFADDTAYALAALGDGGYALAGYTKSQGSGGHDVWVVRTDSSGNPMWDRTRGGGLIDWAHGIAEGAAGHLHVAAHTSSQGKGADDLWLLRLDASGNAVTDATHGGAKDDYGIAVVALPDGGIAVAGHTASNAAGIADAWLLRTDSYGNAACPTPAACSSPSTCDDQNSCTADLCDPAHSGCWHTPIPERRNCDSADACAIESSCQDGACVAVASRLFEAVHGAEGHEEVSGIVSSGTGGFVVAGFTNSKGNGNGDMWVVGTDEAGTRIWDQTHGGEFQEDAHAVGRMPDGGYVLAGMTASKGAGGNDLWLVRLDSMGISTWDRTYGGTDDEAAHALTPTPDGGVAVTGFTTSKGKGGTDSWLVRTDANGEPLWDRTYGGLENDQSRAIALLEDGGFALAGYTVSSGAGASDGWLIRTDDEGNALWERTYGGTDTDDLLGVMALPDGGFALTGRNSSKGAGAIDAWLVRTDSFGLPLWDRTFGGAENDESKALARASDGGFILAGLTASKGAGDRDGWVVRTDRNGLAVWEKTYGGPAPDAFNAMLALPDGGLALAGYTQSSIGGNTDFLLVRTDPWGNASCATSGSCVATTLGTCNDFTECTADHCDAAHDGCWHDPMADATPCGDGPI